MTSLPATSAAVRRAYADQVAVSYGFYVVGAATAFIAVALSLSDTEAGLLSSAMAVGMIVSGVAGERFSALLGLRRAHVMAMALLASSLLALAWAPSLAVTLLASLGIGFGGGTLFGHLNHTLSAGGGAVARLQLTRTSLVSKVAQLMAPVAIVAGAALGLGWQVVVVPVLVWVAGLVFWPRSVEPGDDAVPVPLGRLPSAYWLPWALTVAVVAIEYFVIVWGGTLVESRTGVSLADATLAISAFIVGMLVGRAVMSVRAAARLEAMAVIRGGLALTLGAVLVVWLSGSLALSAAAMAVAGFGIGILYPPAAAITLATAPAAPAAASARLVLAAGVAILVAPLVLGAVADQSDITAAWLLVPVVCVGILGLSVPVERRRQAMR